MRIYNKDGGNGAIVSAHGRFPVVSGCAEVPEAALEDVMRNKDWQPWNGQVPWPGEGQPKTADKANAAKTETPKAPDQAPTDEPSGTDADLVSMMGADEGTAEEGASAPSSSPSESPKPEKPAKPGKRSGSGGKSK